MKRRPRQAINIDSHESVKIIGHRVRQARADFSKIEQIVLSSFPAHGAGRPDSDIDVAVEAGRWLTPEQRIAMIEAMAMEFGHPVDLIDLKSAEQPLLTQIVTTGKCLRGSDTQWVKVIYRNIIDNGDFVRCSGES
nr:nucleotidyltransferase domain-containing protein [uncultured Halomonas sp.]